MFKVDKILCGIESKKLAFVDVETTGLSTLYGDRICEIGIIISSGFNIKSYYSSLVNPQKSISVGATALSGITDTMVKHAPLFKDIKEEVCNLLKDSVFVAHNAPFDLGFLNYELSLLNSSTLNLPYIDTLFLLRKLFKLQSNSLSYAARYFKLPLNSNIHRALPDAFLTYLLLKKIFSLKFNEKICPILYKEEKNYYPFLPP